MDLTTARQFGRRAKWATSLLAYAFFGLTTFLLVAAASNSTAFNGGVATPITKKS
ncbi:MAG: hypothetical protein AAFR23_00300 [Pseudomonadota bacterium]